MEKILIFGSTGSIGKAALNVIRKSAGKFKVLGLCANRDSKTLLAQISEFKPLYVCLRDEAQAKKIQKHLKGVKVFKGEAGLQEFSKIRSDTSVMAISGISALKPLFANIEHAKRIALANKESIVTAGSLVFEKARKFNTQILPVDSEINAIFQIIDASGRQNKFNKLYITASGGALAGYRSKDLCEVTVERVLAHPTWKMGKRITIDCATLVNKAFEVVEAHHFFGLEYEKIDIIMHKQSFVHALIEFKDNALLACLYHPDMKIPISYSLYYPKRFNSASKHSTIFKKRGEFNCSFLPVNHRDYPLLNLVLEAAKRKDNSLVILNACDEIAVDCFLKKKIEFTGIHKAMKYMFKNYKQARIKKIEDVFFWDNWARVKTREYLNKRNK